jgi:hypothetical protein
MFVSLISNPGEVHLAQFYVIQSFMKFCPVVPEMCCGQVHGPRKERRKRKRIIFCVFKIFEMSAIFKMAAKTQYKKWAVKIQHCSISSKFDMWVDNDVPTNQSGHHYLCIYQILMISDNVEFLPPIFYAVFWQPF